MTPRALGFTFPAEFEKQRALWLSWPHKEASWPGKIAAIFPVYAQFIRLVAEGQQVCIHVADEAMKQFALKHLEAADCNLSAVRFYFHPTNDAWCRDHGPAFVVNRKTKEKAIVDWGYNAWGNKYPPYDLDDVIPTLTAQELGLPVFYPNIVMEGGSVEFNGRGTLLTTTSCLLHPNRNPQLTRQDIEQKLRDFYGVSNILWLGDGIAGDDTDGHIDDITRFVDTHTVVSAIEDRADDENYLPLKTNWETLSHMKLEDGKSLNLIALPMPHPVIYEGQRLPASYANFYIANQYVIVPTFRDKVNDDKALDILQRCFSTRRVVGLDSTDLIWGLGSFHCLSQQEPEI